MTRKTIDRIEQVLSVAWLAAGLALAASGLVAGALGGGVFRLAGVALSVQRPMRSLALGCALLLLREVYRSARGKVAERRWLPVLAWLAGLWIALVADSRPRLVGDGQEYAAMAWNLAGGRPPALDAADRAAVERKLSLGDGELGRGREGLVGDDGRQDFHHFWLYSLLVAPFLAAMRLIGGPPLAAFTTANLLLVLASAAVLARRAGVQAMALVFVGPLVWWIDKPHPELLIVSLLVVAVALGPDRPQWALVLAGAVAAQNPVFCVVLLVATAWAWARFRQRPFLFTATAVAWALACANPLYYLHHLGRPVPLRDTVLPHVPGLAELTAVVLDPNLGLLPAWPSLGLAVLLGLAAARRGPRTPGAFSLDGAALLAAVGALLVVFTLPGNLNHGATRGMSRYALWLVPFAVPALVSLGTAGPRLRTAAALLAGASLWSAFPDYLPQRSERYLEPTPLAEWLWTRWPGFDRPLPEVFAERAWGYPPLGRVPASTLRCEMALLRGDGTAIGRWPLACAPAEKPNECRREGRLCYAHRGPEGYRFEAAPFQATFDDGDTTRWFWSGRPEAGTTRLLRSLPWGAFSLVATEDETAFFPDRSGAGRVQVRTAPGTALAWFDGARKAEAFVVPSVRVRSTATLLDPLTGEELSRMPLPVEVPVRILLPPGRPLLLVVNAG